MKMPILHRLSPFSGPAESGTPARAFYSRDGRFLLVSNQYGTLVAFEAETYAEIWRVSTGDSLFADFRLDPERAVVQLHDVQFRQHIHIRGAWHIETGEPAPVQPVAGVAGPRGQWLQREVSRGIEVARRHPLSDRVLGVWPDSVEGHCFSASGHRLALFTEARSLELWSLPDGACLWRRQLSSHAGSLALSPDGRFVLVHHYETGLIFFDAEDGTPVRTVHEDGAGLWTPDGRRFVFCLWADRETPDLVVHSVVDGLPGAQDLVISLNEDDMDAMAISADGERILVAFEGKPTAYIYRLDDGAMLGTHTIPTKPWGPWRLCAGLGEQAGDWDVLRQVASPDGRWRFVEHAFQVLWLQDQHALHLPRCYAAAIGANGTVMAIDDGDAIDVYDLVTRERVATHHALGDRIGGVSFSPDGQQFGIVVDSDTWMIRDAQTGAVLFRQKREGFLRPPIWSPDGRQLALVVVGAAHGYGGEVLIFANRVAPV